MEPARMIWDVDALEVRQRNKRPLIAGRFPYGALAVMSDRGTVRKETFAAGAFAFALEDLSRDIHLLFGHDYGKPLASRQAGNLTLEDTDKALEFFAEIPEGAERATHITDALAMIGAGLVTGVSPGFRVPPKNVVADAETLVPEPGNPSVKIRQIAHAVLYELSLVTRPAYPTTSAELRKMSCNQLHSTPHRVILP